jgi:hypothetical protein
MKFGIFFELSVPKPWHERSEHQVYFNALEQLELADQLGFDQAWAVEHHFLKEYSHCSAPEVFLAAAAMRTQRIRLGHGVMLVLPPSTTRCVAPSGRPPWTSSPTGGWSSAAAAPPPGRSWGASAATPT